MSWSPQDIYNLAVKGIWLTADDNTYLMVNADGSGGNVADGGEAQYWADRSGSGNNMPVRGGKGGVIWDQASKACRFYWKTDGGELISMLANTALAAPLHRDAFSGGFIIWNPGTPYNADVDFEGSSWQDWGLEFMPTASYTSDDAKGIEGYFQGGSFISTGLRHPARKHTVSWCSNGTNFRMWVDGVLYTGPAISAKTLGLLILNSFFGKTFWLSELVAFDSALSDTDMGNLNAYLAGKVDAISTTSIVAILGDSLSMGIGSETGLPWHFALTNRPLSRWDSFAFDGASLVGAPIAAATLAGYAASGESIAILWIGTNDIGQAVWTGLQWAAAMKAYSDTLRAAGWKVIVCTLQDASGSGYGTYKSERLAGNAQLLLDASHYDAIADLGGNADLSDSTNSTYFTSDGTHMKDAGYAIVKTLVDAALASIASPAPTISTSSLPGGITTTAYDQTVEASGGTTPYAWSVISGSLPDGLSINALTGEITGTPTVAGTFDFTVQVEDFNSATNTKALSITIIAVLAITTSSLPGAKIGTAYSQGVSASGGDGSTKTWSIASGSLPFSLSINSSTGVISGMPADTPGTFDFTVQVSDDSQTKTKALSIVLSAPSSGGAKVIGSSIIQGGI